MRMQWMLLYMAMLLFLSILKAHKVEKLLIVRNKYLDRPRYRTTMPIELILSPLMRPIVKAQSYIMGFHRGSSHYTPTIVDKLDSPSTYLVRKEFGTGAKTLSVFRDGTGQAYSDKIYHMTRSRAVKGAYKMYARGDNEHPIAAIRAGLRSNVLLIKTASGAELELGWHVVDHLVDALDDYRVFQLADGETYQWTFKGHFLERVRNIGQKEAEVRERVGYAKVYPNRKGFDLVINEKIVNTEMAIATALICYIEAWNTWRAYGGIYLAEQPGPSLPWKRD